MDDWNRKASWMRAMGATEACFATTGELISVTLGPEPIATDSDRPSPPSLEETQRRMREEHRRIASASSGGPVKRLAGES